MTTEVRRRLPEEGASVVSVVTKIVENQARVVHLLESQMALTEQIVALIGALVVRAESRADR